MLSLAEIPSENFLDGTVVMRPWTEAVGRRPCVIADLHIAGGPDAAARVHSLVLVAGREYFIRELSSSHVELFEDATNTPVRAASLHELDPNFEVLPQKLPVLDTNGVASTFTKFGVGPLGRAKQAWLRDGRAVVPTPLELNRLLEENANFHIMDEFKARNPLADEIIAAFKLRMEQVEQVSGE